MLALENEDSGSSNEAASGEDVDRTDVGGTSLPRALDPD
jgi:hypothetical protein